MRPLKRYFNPHVKDEKRGLWNVFLWQVGYYNDSQKPLDVPPDFSYPLPEQESSSYAATWINHSTFLVQMDGVHILTDPVWGTRCSPLPLIGPKRQHKPPMSLDELPPIDFVLISHNHYDHLDAPTVKSLSKRFPHITWIVPEGVGAWFVARGMTRIVELSWWKSQELGSEWKVTAVPAQHFSGRRGYDMNSTLWAGWVIENGKKTCYFVGDTGYNTWDFQDIGKKWPSIDLSLIPIGSYAPRKFMAPVHVEPKDAVRIHQDVGSRLSLAMHWKTFRLSDEPAHLPPYDLFLSMQEAGLNPCSFLAPPPGHTIFF